MIWPSIVIICIYVVKLDLFPIYELQYLSTTVFVLSLLVPKTIIFLGSIYSSCIFQDLLLVTGYYRGSLMTPFR